MVYNEQKTPPHVVKGDLVNAFAHDHGKGQLSIF